MLPRPAYLKGIEILDGEVSVEVTIDTVQLT